MEYTFSSKGHADDWSNTRWINNCILNTRLQYSHLPPVIQPKQQDYMCHHQVMKEHQTTQLAPKSFQEPQQGFSSTASMKKKKSPKNENISPSRGQV